LDHPNIIKVYGYFNDEEHFYIVLELGSDGQLFDIISNGTTLS
jgi:serine/threonine protein kinase